jgi:hypothetical protein
MERKYILTEEGRRELLASRERVEAGDSSSFELSAQRILLESRSDLEYYKKVVISKANSLYKIHNEIFSRRARTPKFANERIVEMPVIIYDLKESIYPGVTKKENYNWEI